MFDLLLNNPAIGDVSKPIISLIESFAGPVIGVVSAIGVIYCILLGAKLAKAEEPQDREKAKGALKNAIIGFVLIFVLIVALFKFVPIMEKWVRDNTDTNISSDFGKQQPSGGQQSNGGQQTTGGQQSTGNAGGN